MTGTTFGWPATREALMLLQDQLAATTSAGWSPPAAPTIAGSSVVFARPAHGPGRAGDLGWAGAALFWNGELVESAMVHGAAGGPFEPGLLALREGPLLEAAVRALPVRPDVVFVNATGRDHPRRAGLALHLGAVVDMPTVGITRRPLLAKGGMPGPERGARSTLDIDGERVAYWVRTRARAMPVVVHGGWRVDVDTAVALVLAACGAARTPEPLRRAREVARTARHRFETRP